MPVYGGLLRRGTPTGSGSPVALEEALSFDGSTLTLKDAATVFAPETDDGAKLGTSGTLRWADAYVNGVVGPADP